jgi:methylmalonyl-CoA carboxyltransferase 1.3S subunit
MQLKVTVNGVVYDVEVEVEEEPQPTIGAIFMTGGTFSPPHLSAPTPPSGAGDGNGIQAPLAGTVAQVLVEEGQVIEAGDVVVVLEAMKMETEITAPRSGTVGAVLVSAGTAVTGGQVLVELSSPGD